MIHLYEVYIKEFVVRMTIKNIDGRMNGIRSEVVNFCDDIKVDYAKYLYSRNVNYPFCCSLSSNLISSFLNMCYKTKDFKVISSTNPRLFNHTWTSYVNELDGEYFVIDFTGFQSSRENANIVSQLSKKICSLQQLSEFVEKEIVVMDSNKTCLALLGEKVIMPQEQKCYGIIDEYKVELSKECFMKYIDEVFDQVANNVIYY